MTLGELIEVLKRMDSHALIFNLANPHSYRGYYEQLAFELDSGRTMEVGILLDVCEKLVETKMHGYKGGEYIIKLKTPVWIAEYGGTGRPLVSIQDDCKIILGEDD